MKQILTFVWMFFAASLTVQAQIENPVSWNFTAKKISPRVYELHMAASISGNWHIYSQNAGEGPEPTSFSFNKNPLVKLVGKVQEMGKMESAYDPNFKSTLRFYNGKVDFVQKITLRSDASTVLKGNVVFMVCNESRCLPPKEIPFSIKIDNK